MLSARYAPPSLPSTGLTSGENRFLPPRATLASGSFLRHACVTSCPVLAKLSTSCVPPQHAPAGSKRSGFCASPCFLVSHVPLANDSQMAGVSSTSSWLILHPILFCTLCRCPNSGVMIVSLSGVFAHLSSSLGTSSSSASPAASARWRRSSCAVPSLQQRMPPGALMNTSFPLPSGRAFACTNPQTNSLGSHCCSASVMMTGRGLFVSIGIPSTGQHCIITNSPSSFFSAPHSTFPSPHLLTLSSCSPSSG